MMWLFKTPMGAKLWAAGAALVGLVVLVAKIFGAGKQAERAKQNEKIVEVKGAQQKANAAAPRERDDIADKLQSGRF